MSEQILGVLVGGAVAIISGLVVSLASELRGRTEWRRQARLQAARESVRALQTLNREITTLAISDLTAIDGTGDEWKAFHAATIEWNAARHEAALISPARELEVLGQLDQEFDRVLESAVSRQWDASAFRIERKTLGELASQYIAMARKTANEHAAALPSIWSWADDEIKAIRLPNSGSIKKARDQQATDKKVG
jgi:hypothetical protein